MMDMAGLTVMRATSKRKRSVPCAQLKKPAWNTHSTTSNTSVFGVARLPWIGSVYAGIAEGQI